MSTRALNPDTVRREMKDILLNNAGLYETLRQRAAADERSHSAGLRGRSPGRLMR